MGRISLIFMRFSVNIGQITGWLPPPPPVWEILDPPLLGVVYLLDCVYSIARCRKSLLDLPEMRIVKNWSMIHLCGVLRV